MRKILAIAVAAATMAMASPALAAGTTQAGAEVSTFQIAAVHSKKHVSKAAKKKKVRPYRKHVRKNAAKAAKKAKVR